MVDCCKNVCVLVHFLLQESAKLHIRACSALTRRSRAQTTLDDIRVSTSPAKWPGVDNVVALLGREKDEDAPLLRLLLIECFVAITMLLSSY